MRKFLENFIETKLIFLSSHKGANQACISSVLKFTPSINLSTVLYQRTPAKINDNNTFTIALTIRIKNFYFNPT